MRTAPQQPTNKSLAQLVECMFASAALRFTGFALNSVLHLTTMCVSRELSLSPQHKTQTHTHRFSVCNYSQHSFKGLVPPTPCFWSSCLMWMHDGFVLLFFLQNNWIDSSIQATSQWTVDIPAFYHCILASNRLILAAKSSSIYIFRQNYNHIYF